MKHKFIQIALIGATASGKSSLSIELAKKYNSVILSLDSLAVYKDIDIASAKPLPKERQGIVHFGIDEIYPNEPFDVTIFIQLYKKSYDYATKNKKNLIIVGGSSFYLKTLLSGISSLPGISHETKERTSEMLNNIQSAFEFLYKKDSEFMQKIKANDRYRIEKALNIFFQTDTIPSIYFKNNPPTPIISDDLPIFEIDISRDILRDRIKQRTIAMVENGLIEEVKMLENKYGKDQNPMKAIGIKETLDLIDGKITKNELIELISTHTAQLAKRQTTFNRTQFDKKIMIKNDEIEIFDGYFN